MSTSRVGAAIDALYARAVAVVGGQAVVVDGPVVTHDELAQAVIIGWDGIRGTEGGSQAAVTDWSQEWAGLGKKSRNETFSIVGCVVVWDGDEDAWKTKRDSALALLALLEDDLRNDPSMGVSPQPFQAELATGQLYQESGAFGQQARIPFTVLIRHDRI